MRRSPRAEATGERAGFRAVLCCDGCARTLETGSQCPAGLTLRPCLIDPHLCAPWPACDPAELQHRRLRYRAVSS